MKHFLFEWRQITVPLIAMHFLKKIESLRSRQSEIQAKLCKKWTTLFNISPSLRRRLWTTYGWIRMWRHYTNSLLLFSSHYCSCCSLLFLLLTIVPVAHYGFCCSLLFLLFTIVSVAHYCSCCSLLFLLLTIVPVAHYCTSCSLFFLLLTIVLVAHYCSCYSLLFLLLTFVPVAHYCSWQSVS
jgi:hypothetical protein